MMRLIRRKWFWTGITMLYVGFIFHNSMTPALKSSQQSGRVLTIVLEIVSRLGVTGTWITEHLIRKTAHFAEYTLLGILLGVNVRQYSFKTEFLRVMQCWLGMMIPFVDETIQLFVKGRSGQISDVWLDMAGVFAGYLVIEVMLWLKKPGEK